MTKTSTRQNVSPTRGRRRWIVISAVVALVAAAGFLIWFFNREVPEEVSLDAAVAGLETTTTAATNDEPAPTSTTVTTTEPPSGEGSAPGVDGAWTVDTTVGSFSFEEATSSFVGFRIAEELAGIGSTEAVGRTPIVSGSFEFEGTTLTAATIEADLRSIVTNDSRRDDRVQSALETSSFPLATFELGEPLDFGAIPAEGTPISVTARGTLTAHGVTLPLEVPLEAQLAGEFIVVVGSTTITMADFGVTVPSAPIVLSASDQAVLEIQLFLTRAG